MTAVVLFGRFRGGDGASPPGRRAGDGDGRGRRTDDSRAALLRGAGGHIAGRRRSRRPVRGESGRTGAGAARPFQPKAPRRRSGSPCPRARASDRCSSPRRARRSSISAPTSSKHPGGSLEELFTVYAIVNALTVNLPAIIGVQILVDGHEVDTLAGSRRPAPAARPEPDLLVRRSRRPRRSRDAPPAAARA